MTRATGHAAGRTGREWRLAAVCAGLFVAAAAATVDGCMSMSAMGGMDMPGGWELSMTWMRMPGQSWPDVAAAFLAMWMAMTVAMMLPSLLPVLRRYGRALGAVGSPRPGALMAWAGAGYFLAWAAAGGVILPLGLMLAQAELRQPAWARAVPALAGAAVLLAGAMQLSAWKARRLACCRAMPAPGHGSPATAAAAGRLGMRLGWHCIACCAPQTIALLAMGMMDLRAMAVATLAISAERLAPAGQRVARAIGIVTLGWGVLLAVQAVAAM